MKYRRLKLLLCAMCVMIFAGALAACRQSILTLDDIKDSGYVYSVVFDLAGGTSGKGDRERTELHQYVKGNSIIVQPGTDPNGYSGEAPVRAGYTLGGYYRGSKAADGTITYTERWDFSKDTVTEDLTLYALWRPNYRIVIHYKNGAGEDQTSEVEVVQDESGAVGEVARPAITGYTVIAYYESAALAEEGDESKALTFPLAPGDHLSESNPTWDIYADALEGTFKLIRERSDFRSINTGTNIYLMADIDFGGDTLTVFPADYGGKFYGCGHTLSNFTVERTSAARQNDYLGIFKRVTATAVIQDVTFRDFVLKVKTTDANRDYAIGALAGRAVAGAVLKNITLAGRVECDITPQGESNQTVFHALVGEMEEGLTPVGCNTEGVTVTGYDPS